MSDQPGSVTHGYYDTTTTNPNKPPRQPVKLLTAATIGVTLLILSGLTLTGTVIALAVVTPLLFLFSPILVPAGIALFLVSAGFLFAGGCGVAAIAALSWVYNYVAGKHPLGADRFDYAGAVIADKVRDMKERARDYGYYAQGVAQGTT